MSALAGSGFVLMLTPVAAVRLPVMPVITMPAILAGQALGSSVPGVGLRLGARRVMPGGVAGQFALAGPGAVTAGLVPMAGWLFALPGGWLLRRSTAQA